MKLIKTLIVDDEPLARAMVAKLLETEADIELVGEAAEGRAALTLINRAAPELLFLDVQMPGMSGIELLQKLPAAKRPAVIFVTAYDAFALKAFELHAIDFLLKPYTDERFHAALARMRRQLRQADIGALTDRMESLLKTFSSRSAHVRSGAAAEVAASAPLQLVAKSGSDIHVFRTDQIKWVEGQGDYLKIHGTAGSALVRETMTHFLGRVPGGQFVRVHKSTIVNLTFVRRLEPIYSGDYRLELTDGTVLRVSRHYREQLVPLLQV
ncbi:MAG: DNA-binding response regulator [Opitutus sp.]|nr:DNA-binding response regulator [Opitutus sp.]